MATFAEWQENKKKKKKSTENTTFSQYTRSVLGDDVEINEIGPVKQTKKEEESTWFKSGDKESVANTALGSSSDLLENFGAGFLGIGEKFIDSLLYVAPLITQGQYYQNGGGYNLQTDKMFEETIAQSKKENQEFIDKDLYDEKAISRELLSNVPSAMHMSNIAQSGQFATPQDWQMAQQMQSAAKDYLDNDMEKASVFGEKSDALAQSAGQLGATVALQAAGVPWWLTTGAASFGSEVESAFNQGATYEEAGLSASITAGAEILTEKISGGIKFGGKTLDEAATKQLSRVITNKVARTLTKVGMDVAGEGGEEVLSGYLSAIGQKLTYADEKELNELFSSEDALDSFIGGAILGGVSSGGNAISDSVKGNDYASGLTNSEKAVVDKVYNVAIAEREADGKKLTQREKAKLYDEAVNALEKGYIDTDTIESVVGGDTYSSLKAITEQETASKSEYDALYQMKNGEKSDAQVDRQAELKKYLEDAATKKAQLRESLDGMVSEFVKDNKLSEVYNEQERKKQLFEADLTKYDSKQAEVVKKAVESGILNNTNKTHDFVDMIAKLSAEKGVSFNFTDNQRLKESGFAVDGATVNGFVDGKDITLNIDSPKALNTVVGHEITHVLEGTELYGELQAAVKEYAETKGEYSKRLEAIRKLYEGRNADIEAEITADLVGDYLFTDSDFISKLSAEKPNIFKRIFEEIKYLYKVATAGSKEAKQLEKVKRAFEKAYRGNSNVNNGGAVKHSLNKVTDNKVADRLTSEEWETVKSSVANHKNLNHYYQKSADGGIIIPVNNKLVFTDADMDSPGINKIVEFESEYENDIDYAREEFYAVEKGESTVEEAYEIVRLFTKIENINEYETENRQNDGKYDRRTGRGKGQSDTYHDNFLQERIRRANETINAVNNEKASSQDGVFFDAKNSNTKYSVSDKDIRFSLSETVEETKDLIAVHNLGTAQLLKTLELGGFPMPSIAITKDDFSHNKYGEISILFGKETIDPQFFRSNKVYGGDAWTPVYPKIEYEVNDKVQRAISEKYYELHNKIPSRFDRTAYRLVSDLEDMINREGGEAGLIESLKNDYGMKQFYLAETGNPVEDVITSTTTEMTEAEKEMCQYFLDNERELVESYKQNSKNPQGFLAWTKENAEKLENAYRKYLKNEFDFTEDEIHNVLENTKLVHLKRFISDAVRYEETGGITTKEEYDSTATHDAIDNAVDQAKYEEWLNALLKGVEKSSGIRNNVDYFTNSGNRRSFKALHYENTLENVVKVMKAQDNGQAFISGLGIWGVSAKDYGSIAEIKADSSRLEHRDASEYSAMKQEYGDRLTEIANKIADKNHYNQFIAMDNAMENIVDAVRKSKRPSDIARYLEEYHQISNPLEVAQEIVDLVTDISNMPTEYFEAKPQRAVGLDEIATVILPKDADEKLKTALSERNIPYVEYDGTAEDRLAKLNGEAIAKDKKFSLSEQGRGYAPIGTYNVYGQDLALNLDIAPVAEKVQEPVETVQEDIAPVVSDTEVAESVDWREEVRNMREPELEGGNWTEEYIDYHNSVRRKAQMAALKEVVDDVDSGMTPAELRQKAEDALREYESAKPAHGEDYTQAQEVMLAALYGQYSFYDSASKNPNWADEMRAQLEPAPMTEEQASERDEQQYENFYSLEENEQWDSEEPWENFAPTTYTASVDSPFDDKDIKEVGNRKIKAYMYENPEVKPFFQEEAQNMLYELKNSVKGEKYYNDNLHYQTNGDMGWFGTTRMTSPEIAYLLDNFKYTYAEIEKGLNAIIEDHGAENNAVSKRIEFLLDERLREGYKHFIYGDEIPPNQGYINLLTEKQITEYNDEAFNRWASTLSDADVQAIAPEPETVEAPKAPEAAKVQQTPAQPKTTEEAPLYEAQPKKGVTEGQLSMFNEAEQATHLDRVLKRIDNRLEREKAELAEEFRQKKADLQEQLGDKNAYFSNKAKALYDEIVNLRKGVRASKQLGYLLDYGYDWNHVKRALLNIYHHPESRVNDNLIPESIAREMLETEYEDSVYDLDDLDTEYQKRIGELEAEAEKERADARKAEQAITRKELHETIIGDIRSKFAVNGYDLDDVLNSAKDLSTFATVDNTPQRVMEKALGYKEGQVLSDLTVNQVAQNESEGIKWLNSFTDRKNGLLAQISKQYGIKPGSKASAAAQMYAEGFYVDENNDIIAYGDAELAKDFPNRRVQENIKGLANDGRIRQIYDETLKMINESRTRNAYPEIPRLDNYFLHFRAMDDTFSRLGLPFNPNDIRAKDLPTDLNGVTADLKPGQPYFASAKHRTGKRTSFDLLGGLERYLSSAKNQIYHIDDIQTLRALRNYIADTYGQAHGLEGLDTLTEDEAQERIKEVYGSHLSTFAKFLNEEANVLAGKTSLIDRGLEGVIGRRGITFLDTVNRQVGANMVGFNISSSLTNFVSVAQAFAKSNKAAFVKAFAQTASNKLGSIVGRNDGFTEQSPVMIRRKGAESFYRTPWQKAGDAGYFLMSAVDNISTELIARTKYNELVSKGMDAQKAHYETDKWVSRLMGDRSLGQQPQIYNSKMLGILTKFQLEVRNQLDSQFYDTIQEAKVSNEEVQNRLARNAKTAAKVTSTFFQLAVAQHLFGKAFESVAGYNPAFDIISVLIKALGFDDDDESEDTVLDNVEQGFLELLGDLPYTSIFTGGRIPIESALPIEQLVTGKDDYGNEKSRWETLGEAAPYYVLPGGYNQIKKTSQGLGMFDDDLPIAGSYTDSGNLRFTVDDTLQNRVQAGVFGQWASDEARDYFDNERNPLKEKQIQELVDLDLPIREYWDYREGLAEQKTLEDKFDYIAGLDVSVEQKNIMINNVVDRKEAVDMSNYDDFADYEEFDFYTKNTEKYNFLEENGVSYKDYISSEDAKKEYDSAYSWYKNNPEKVTVSKAITDNVIEYRRYTSELNDIRADKDENGDSISGSAKEKKAAYINQLDLDYGQKIILFRTYYDSQEDKSTYNGEIVEYLNDREDISYEEMVAILKELDMKVYPDGRVEW